MKITVKNAEAREVVKKIAKFAAKELGVNKNHILVHFYDLKSEDCYGLCSMMHKRAFLIGINYKLIIEEFENEADRYFNLADTICHEMTHLRQFFTGELKHTDSGEDFLWKSGKYRGEDEPWELEAWDLGNKLATKFFESLAHNEH